MTAYSVTSGTGTAVAEPVTAVAEKSVMQDMEETGLEMVGETWSRVGGNQINIANAGPRWIVKMVLRS